MNFQQGVPRHVAIYSKRLQNKRPQDEVFLLLIIKRSKQNPKNKSKGVLVVSRFKPKHCYESIIYPCFTFFSSCDFSFLRTNSTMAFGTTKCDFFSILKGIVYFQLGGIRTFKVKLMLVELEDLKKAGDASPIFDLFYIRETKKYIQFIQLFRD